jgi:hypothetical protein
MTGDVYSVRVAGVSYYQDNIGRIEPGDECLLRPEPDNPFDPSAIQVLCRSEVIGYIPREHSALLLQALAAGVVGAVVEGKGRPDNSKYVGVSLRLTVSWHFDEQ